MSIDDVTRPALQAEQDQAEFGVNELHGRIVVENPAGARMKLGFNTAHADVTVAPLDRGR